MGQALLNLEQGWIDAQVQDTFGYEAFQVGPSRIDALRNNRILNRRRISLFAPKAADFAVEDQPELVCAPTSLPIESESTDLLVLAHALEVCQDPHALVREADRILIPEGRLVVVGLNPMSLWSLHRPVASVRFPAAELHWISTGRLRDWCRLLDLSVEAGAMGMYRPICQTQRCLDRLVWMESAGARWWPGFGASYCITAVKRRAGMRLLSAKWKKAEQSSVGQVIGRPIGVEGP
jgi:SAM-dependent methyltransferase